MTSNDRDDIKVALVQNDLRYIKEKVDAVDKKLSENYVTKDEFDPVKKIVYGIISLILVSVVTALLALVIGSEA